VGIPPSMAGCVEEVFIAELREEDDCITDEEWELEGLEYADGEVLEWDDMELEEAGESRDR
jgi:hypothetical protein